MDVVVAPRVTSDIRNEDLHTRSVVVAVANGKPGPVVLEFHQPRIGRDFAISGASGTPTAKAGDEVWTLRLRSGERAQLSYTMSFRD
jgi:hypothetical protein